MSNGHDYFGKYILLEKVASGGMAEVFLARAPGAGGIGKYVAIKRILPQFSDNKEFIEMFKNEAKIAINLSHSNVVSIYEFGIVEGQFFLVMELVKGQNIRQILKKLNKDKGRLSVDQIVYICKEIASGLDHAHRCVDGTTGKSLNIIHRDMSPQNVMVSYEGEIKIIDFGIAKAETQMDETRSGTLKGKFGYMSPEQVEGQAVDLRTDIFSLGIVLWERLANERLFIANNEVNTLRKIRDCNIPNLMRLNPEVHPELERICMKALTKDKNMRYQTASSLQRDLSKFLNRHFPDFSTQDFAIVVKSLYTEEIMSLSDRMIEYAKIPFVEHIDVHSARADGSEETYIVNPDGTGSHSGQTGSYSTHPGEKTEMQQPRVHEVDEINIKSGGTVENTITLLHRKGKKKTMVTKSKKVGLESTIQVNDVNEKTQYQEYKKASGDGTAITRSGPRTRTNVTHNFIPAKISSRVRKNSSSTQVRQPGKTILQANPKGPQGAHPTRPHVKKHKRPSSTGLPDFKNLDQQELLSFVLIATALALFSYLFVSWLL